MSLLSPEMPTSARPSRKVKSSQHKYYPSNAKGQYAVNAVTGESYPYKIGTPGALRLFRVKDSTGRCDDEGFLIKRTEGPAGPNRDTNYLYYDGPKEYKEHRNPNVSQELIERWNTFQKNLKTPEGGINMRAYDEYKESCRFTYQ